MRWILAAALLLVTSGTPSTPVVRAAEGDDITGVYICNGLNPDGRPYKGFVQILKVKDAFEVRWIFGHELSAVGVGIRTGGVLAVSYFSGLPGVVAYKIGADAKLTGQWTVVGGDGAVFEETLTKTTDDALPKVAPEKPEPSERSETPRPRRPRSEPTSGRGTRSI